MAKKKTYKKAVKKRPVKRRVVSRVKKKKLVTSALMKKRQQAKSYMRKKSFRPRLKITKKGVVYASPHSGGGYLVNPNKRKIMKKRKTSTLLKRGRKKSYRRNPSMLKGGLKSAFSKQNIINIAALGAGFVGGIKASKYINDVETLSNYRRFTGVIPFILGTFLSAKGKKESIKSLGKGVSLSGLYDLITQNVPQLALAPIEGVDLDDNTYYTQPNVDGEIFDLEGETLDLDGQTEMVGEEPIIVGDDSPYALV